MFQLDKVKHCAGFVVFMLCSSPVFSQPIRLTSDKIQDEESASLYYGDSPEAECDVEDTDSFKFKVRLNNTATQILITNSNGSPLPSATNVSLTFPIPTIGEGLIKETGPTLTSDSYFLLYRMAPQGLDSKILVKLNPARDFEAYDIELETVQVNASIGPNSATPTLSSINIRLSTTDQVWLSGLGWLTSGTESSNISNGIEFRFNLIKTNKADYSSLYAELQANAAASDIGDVVFTISD